MQENIIYATSTFFFLFMMTAMASPLSYQPSRAQEFGFNLVSWDRTGTVDGHAWKQVVREMHHAGIQSVTVITYRFVHKTRGNISTVSQYGLAPPPGDDAIIAALEEGKQWGMRVSLNPFTEIDNPNGIGHKWRGMLNFSGEELQTFFKHYRAYITRMAQIAASQGASRLYIGSELKALARNPEAQPFWSQMINEVRRVFGSKGTLAYAADHDNYKHVPFWDQLDEIGIDVYFSLASRSNAEGTGKPPVRVIETNWDGRLKALQRFSEQQEKPVILSEWGVTPFDLTTYQPWNWKPSDTVDPLEQRNAYHATINAVVGQGDWLRGIHFWHWGMEGSFGSNYSMTPNSDAGQWLLQQLIGRAR